MLLTWRLMKVEGGGVLGGEGLRGLGLPTRGRFPSPPVCAMEVLESPTRL